MTCQMVYHNGNCLNTKRPYARSCKLCIESCPHQAISEYRELDTKQCTECGVCMAVCPSGGFVDHSIDKLHNYLSESDKIVLNCPRAVPQGFEISCLGILDRDSWMTLMLLAKEKTATIITGVCSDCEDRQACASSVEIFKQVHADWPDHPAVHIKVRPDQGLAEKPVLTEVGVRRTVTKKDSKLGWRQKSREKIEEWLPSMAADESYQIPKTRQWLLEAFEASAEEKIPFHALAVVADSCTSCGVCAAICPQGALQKREERNSDIGAEDQTKEEQITSMRLIFEPQKCVQCHRCVETCRSKALTFSCKPLSHRLITGKILVHEGCPKYCNQCGKRIFDKGELCLVCATGDPANRGFFSL
ncbi:4Fe-4S binding protein [Desulfosporosinus nitroreducens]|uniref:4Fe-4S binding protein n=1 Tax=Desulfosporosinus nitroreducens TaxID=2018668 RepID=UPI00207D50F9|nr:4Fe-4S binding protein [Desulfosporosinus nitroreducens]MCO1599959.1 4Fe-4S binding protein [Desulfosporosinus nitroreducens]